MNHPIFCYFVMLSLSQDSSFLVSLWTSGWIRLSLRLRSFKFALNQILVASQFLVVACSKMVMSIAINVTEVITSKCGTFRPTKIPDNAPRITSVSRVQHIKCNSRKFHLARLSGKAQANATSGLAMNINTSTMPKAGRKY